MSFLPLRRIDHPLPCQAVDLLDSGEQNGQLMGVVHTLLNTTPMCPFYLFEGLIVFLRANLWSCWILQKKKTRKEALVSVVHTVQTRIQCVLFTSSKD